jgi:hypothetical protein
MRQIHKALQQMFDDPSRRSVALAFLYFFKNQVMTTVTFSTAAATNFTSAGQFTALVDGVTVQPTAANASFTLPAGFVVPNSGTPWGVCGLATDKFGNLYYFPAGQTFGSLGAIIYPAPPDTKDGTVVLCYFILNNGSAGTFTGGTTNTNTAGLVWTFALEYDGIYQINNYGQV